MIARRRMSPGVCHLVAGFVAVSLAACGRSSDQGKTETMGPVVDGSSFAGLIVAATNIDQSVGTSRVYYYEFRTGRVRELLSAEGIDPAVFFTDNRAFLFNRSTDRRTVRIFDPRAEESVLPEEQALSDLAAGDPWDIETLATGKSIVLASLFKDELQVLDLESGTLGNSNVTLSPGRPRSFLRRDNQLKVLTMGLTADQKPDGDAEIAFFSTSETGLIKQRASIHVPGEGVPSALLNRDESGGATIVSLCEADNANCQPKAFRLTSAGTLQPFAFSGTTPPVYSFNKTVDGPSPAIVHAHVSSRSGFWIIRLDLNTNDREDLVSLGDDERIYGLAFDASAGILFVGGHKGLKGQLTLFKNDKDFGACDLDGVPYSIALVPK